MSANAKKARRNLDVELLDSAIMRCLGLAHDLRHDAVHKLRLLRERLTAKSRRKTRRSRR